MTTRDSTPSDRPASSGDSPKATDTSRPDNQGEGNRDAARRYDAAAKSFAESGQVERAAQAAAPRDEAEARALEAAEREGRAHAKDEDPTVPGANETHQREKR